MNIELKLVRSSWILIWIIMHIKIFIQGDGKERNLVELWIQVKECQEFPPGCGTVDQIFRSSGGIMGAGGLQKSDPLLPAIRSFNDQSVCVLACFQGYALSLNLVLVFRYRISRYS